MIGSDLRQNSPKAGTNTGQSFSLYDALNALCKEKKNVLTPPIPYIDYIPPKLVAGKVWYVSYSRKFASYWSYVIRPSLGFPKELQFYSLKDTGITNMVNSGVPLTSVQQQADHSSLAITSIYIGKTERASEALKAVDIID